MISTLTISNDLAPVFGLLGYAGVVVALIAAIAVAVAGSVDHPDAVGISAGVWLTGVLLSCCACFTGHVWVMVLAVAGLPAAALVALASRIVIKHLRGSAQSAGMSRLRIRYR